MDEPSVEINSIRSNPQAKLFTYTGLLTNGAIFEEPAMLTPPGELLGGRALGNGLGGDSSISSPRASLARAEDTADRC